MKVEFSSKLSYNVVALYDSVRDNNKDGIFENVVRFDLSNDEVISTVNVAKDLKDNFSGHATFYGDDGVIVPYDGYDSWDVSFSVGERTNFSILLSKTVY